MNSHQAAPDGERRGACPIGNAELLENIFDVRFNRVFRDVQIVGDFLVRFSGDDLL